jgi:hypothetical protein
MALMEFYCCDCELIFESEPDGTGYDQAPCPQCQQICMTSEFEGKATKKEEKDKKVRFIVVAEFLDEESAEPVVVALEDAGLEIQITLPDVTEGDFFMGGVSENVCVMVDAEQADIARQVIQAIDEEE